MLDCVARVVSTRRVVRAMTARHVRGKTREEFAVDFPQTLRPLSRTWVLTAFAT